MFQNAITVVSNLLTETNAPGWEYQEQVVIAVYLFCF